MDDRWTNIEIFNAVLSNAPDKRDAVQYYLQQLWQMDNLIVLLGAGFSKHVGGPLMSDLSKAVLPPLIYRAAKAHKACKPFVAEWRRLWDIQDAVWAEIESSITADAPEHPPILADYCSTMNIETKVSALQAVASGQRLLGNPDQPFTDVLDCIKDEIVSTIAGICPPAGTDAFAAFTTNLRPYRDLIKRLISYRRPQQPRVKLFTLNYDMVIEMACDLEGVTCITGFEGKAVRILNPTAFDLDPSFRPTWQASVHYPDVVHLYKLHGSVGWTMTEVDGVPEVVHDPNASSKNVVIYPCYTKFAEALELPYYEMFRRLGDAVSQSQTAILTFGYGFNDEHVNQMLRRAFKNPSCQFVLCEPLLTAKTPIQNVFLKAMMAIAQPKGASAATDPRVTVLGGASARFPDVLDIIFQPATVESPSDQIRNLIRRLLEIGGR